MTDNRKAELLKSLIYGINASLIFLSEIENNFENPKSIKDHMSDADITQTAMAIMASQEILDTIKSRVCGYASK